jgi:NAD+ kinase
MKVAIYGRVFKKENSRDIQALLDYLHKCGVVHVTEELYYAQCVASGIRPRSTETFTTPEDITRFDPDLFIVLGGDGTILDSIVYITDHSIPVLGINTGRLGFLAGETNGNDIERVVDMMLKGHYSIDHRSALQLESNMPLFDKANFALNDLVIHKKDSSSMITIHTYLNGEYLNSYWSDGLIISTPTGSTGYSLSCGGPILYPGSNSFVITPLAPHNLNVRPMVISDSHVISFEVEGRNTNFLVSLDSRSESVTHHIQLAVRKAPFSFKLVRFRDDNYLKTLRRKLMWGLDNRNS